MKWFAALTLAAVAGFGLFAVDADGSANDNDVTAEAYGPDEIAGLVGNEAVASGNCTCWYYSRGRWRGISGLSYYHAARIRDSIIRRGGRAYVRCG